MLGTQVRKRLEAAEERLSPWAARSRLSRGRLRREEPSPVRTEFQRDRDRLLYSKAFRRLKHKTQVFVAPLGDHYVTRLTHTLEVAQIARTIVRALNLNEDLAEAISLGHDLGHTPFGHIGEEVLNELYPPGFRHNEQSLRVVDFLEKDGRGLNLTYEVREGILHHSKTGEEVLGEGWGEVETLEGQAVKLADLVAYINHDTEDALRAGVIAPEDLPRPALGVLGASLSQRINTLVLDIVEASWAATGEGGQGKPSLTISPPVRQAAEALREFLYQRVYNPRSAREETERSREVVRLLYRYFLEHPQHLPAEFLPGADPLERKVVDYIAGMTDRYALRLAAEIEPGKIWLLPAV